MANRRIRDENLVVMVNLLTNRQVSRLFGRTHTTILNWRRKLNMPHMLIPGDRMHAVRYDAEEILDWAINNGKAIVRPDVLRMNYRYFMDIQNVPEESLVHTSYERRPGYLEEVEETMEHYRDHPNQRMKENRGNRIPRKYRPPAKKPENRYTHARRNHKKKAAPNNHNPGG